jgi:hypothetical protein
MIGGSVLPKKKMVCAIFAMCNNVLTLCDAKRRTPEAKGAMMRMNT